MNVIEIEDIEKAIKTADMKLRPEIICLHPEDAKEILYAWPEIQQYIVLKTIPWMEKGKVILMKREPTTEDQLKKLAGVLKTEKCNDCIQFGTVFEDHTMPGQRPIIVYGCRRIANEEVCKFEPYPKTDMEKAAEQVQAIREELERKMDPLLKFLNDKLQEAAEQVNKAYENARRKK